ncbi:AAA family ATPase [Ornithinicoccus hortensis]
MRASDSTLATTAWPATLAPVAYVLERGLDLGPATVLVGENGTGKSTLVEAIAIAYGLSPEGGSTGAMHSTRRTESDLAGHLSLVRGAGASRWGYFLRAETMHGLFSYLQDTLHEDFHRFSHGEAFLAMITSRRFDGDGFFVLDEPESGLSFTGQLTLLGALSSMLAAGRTQVLLATHSPVLASLPGARLLELDEDGIHERAWAALPVVDHYRRFLDSPERYLRHLVD